jgi:hypothetical protein
MLNREPTLRRGERLLKEWGLATDAAVEALQAATGRDLAADVAIAARLGGLPQQESVDALVRLEAASPDKLVRKEVRRSFYRLGQRGLTVPDAAPAHPSAPLVTAAPLEGYLSPVDGSGDQLVWLLKPFAGGVGHLFAVINDPLGLKEVSLAETTRKSLRAAREALREKHDLRLVEADWRYCDFLIDRAFHWAVAQGRSVTGDWRGLRAQLTKEPVQEQQPLILGLLDAAAVRADAALVADSHLLLEETEFHTWFFTADDLKPYIDEMLTIKDSPIVLNATQQQERFRALVGRAIEELFGGERQASWVRRLEEMAYFLHATGRTDQAQRALAAALALEASPRGGRDNGFCEQLARSSLAVYWQIESEREAEQSRSALIVTPQQAAREAERRRTS